ncbi:glycerate dehydrogenase [Lentibacillus populi]|uniref:Glycerate dehydrogenase n=1 Tax=Lentibacillus populi TaxID=1827502 RepID=A0A9W5U102_9BACI|nr:D-2-hydroxyacid dehydrogenase [Lentibacillus populi]GGB57825.1 glycerate dehydrogenase [Lentibacillus populi]
MTILFSTKLSAKHQKKLMQDYPEQSFVFCDNMKEASAVLPEAEVLATYGGDLTDDLIEKAVNLKWIMVLSAGMDQMPLTSLKNRNILVTNARGIHKTPMSEYVIALLLQVYRQTKTLLHNETNHYWDKSVRMQELTGKTMLIAGAGAIGQEVARLAKAFRMKTIGVSRSGRPVEHFDENYSTAAFDRLLPKTDIVVSVLPSTAETTYFYTYDHFQKLPDHAVFLNIGRGDAVKTDVVLKAIRQGEIAHAVLDVFETEPLPEDSPLWQEENITITPHISGVSPQYVTRALEIFTRNLDTYLQDSTDYMNQIDLARGY